MENKNQEGKVFDINTPELLFYSLCRVLKSIKLDTIIDIERLFYLIMGVNHLREWIAPGYCATRKDKKSNKYVFAEKPIVFEEYVSWAVYNNCPDFDIVKKLCNHTKHMKPLKFKVETKAEANFDDWEDFDAVTDVDRGPATAYEIEGRNVLEILEAVINFYKKEWFDKIQDDKQ